MMEDLIKAFTTYAGPDTDAQRKQYQRMLDLTRSAANASTGLYGDDFQNRELFVDLHLAELKALAYSNNRNCIKAKYCCFQTAIRKYRNNQCCKGKCREYVLVTETALLKAIHKLETESWLERLGYIVLLSIGIPFIGVLLWVLGYIELPDRLTQVIGDALPTVLTDPLWLVLVFLLLIMLFLVMLLLLRRLWSDLRGRMKTDVNK